MTYVNILFGASDTKQFCVFPSLANCFFLRFKFYLKFSTELDLRISSAHLAEISDIHIAFWCEEILGVLTSQSEVNGPQAWQQREPVFSADESCLTRLNVNIHQNNHE